MTLLTRSLVFICLLVPMLVAREARADRAVADCAAENERRAAAARCATSAKRAPRRPALIPLANTPHHPPFHKRARYGQLITQLLDWTDAMLRQLDEYGIVDTPWRSGRVSGGASDVLRPKLSAAKVAGRGYGLVARFDF